MILSDEMKRTWKVMAGALS